MARPRKAPADRRDRKIVVWTSAQEQARYLVNAARAGQTGPDYARTLLCRLPASPSSAVRQVRLLLPAEVHQRLLAASAAAQMSPEEMVAGWLDGHRVSVAPADGFELVDALTRIGTDLMRLVGITAETGYVPEEIEDLLARLDRLLDRVTTP